jgi:hypothetical protein
LLHFTRERLPRFVGSGMKVEFDPPAALLPRTLPLSLSESPPSLQRTAALKWKLPRLFRCQAYSPSPSPSPSHQAVALCSPVFAIVQNASSPPTNEQSILVQILKARWGGVGWGGELRSMSLPAFPDRWQQCALIQFPLSIFDAFLLLKILRDALSYITAIERRVRTAVD